MQRLVGSAARRFLAGFMSSSPRSYLAKKQKTSAMAASNTKTIGTHSGTFHCDEALGCFLLHQTKVRARLEAAHLLASRGADDIPTGSSRLSPTSYNTRCVTHITW